MRDQAFEFFVGNGVIAPNLLRRENVLVRAKIFCSDTTRYNKQAYDNIRVPNDSVWYTDNPLAYMLADVTDTLT
ncbi:hypothetical protein GCM10027341_11830 [Spirosoma knui]